MFSVFDHLRHGKAGNLILGRRVPLRVKEHGCEEVPGGGGYAT